MAGVLLSASAQQGSAPSSARFTTRKSAEKLERAGLENLFRLSPRLYSGGQPEGEAAFQALRALGVRTIVSVDGGIPDLEQAHRYGMRYVHLPTGYDAISPQVALGILVTVTKFEGPFYVHCHHGKHRGPAAAAIALRGLEGWTSEECRAWMRVAGTSESYAGLYESVATFQIPNREELEGSELDLPERAPVSQLVEAMVEIDALWDRVKAERGVTPVVDADHRKARAHAALLLEEQFRELIRREDVRRRGKPFEAAIVQTVEEIAALRAILEREAAPGDLWIEEEHSALKRITQNCVDCHKTFRDKRGK
jgi:protein tyrosine phosphatase (PTP) superfamily phosphohydrolase (DUF442 family)